MSIVTIFNNTEITFYVFVSISEIPFQVNEALL